MKSRTMLLLIGAAFTLYVIMKAKAKADSVSRVAPELQ